MELEYIIEQLQKAFETESIKEVVVDSNWLAINKETGINSTGFCFAASEVIYRLTGGSDIWTVKRLSNIDNLWDGGTHYFLEKKSNKEILDITSDQYTKRGITVPYELAKGTGLRNVSKKARLLAELSGLGKL